MYPATSGAGASYPYLRPAIWPVRSRRGVDVPLSRVPNQRRMASVRFLLRLVQTEKAVTLGGAIILGIVMMALLPNAIAVSDPNRIDVSVVLIGPSTAHPLGTDELGRDVWSRVVFGTRVSLGVALASVGSALVVGSIIGVSAAWTSARIDNLIMRLMDLAFAFPSILLAMMILSLWAWAHRATSLPLQSSTRQASRVSLEGP